MPTLTLRKSTRPRSSNATAISRGHLRCDAGAIFVAVVAGQPEADRDARADRGPHGGEHLDREANPVLERPAVLVVAFVGVGREELVDQVVVGAVELDAVEAAADGVAGRDREVLDDVRDLVPFERLGRLDVDGAVRGSQQRSAVPVGAALGPAVRELDEGQRAVAMDGVRQRPEVGNGLGRPSVGVVPHRIGGRGMDVGMTHDDHAGPARRPVLDVPAEPSAVVARLAPHRVRLAHHREVGAEDDAVARDQGSDGERLEKSSVARHG